MNHRAQAGFTLLEAAISSAIVALVAGGSLFAISSFGRFTANQAGPVRKAALLLADQTLRVAQDAWKYGSPGNAPSGSTIAQVPVAFPNATPSSAPVTVSTTISSITATDAQITVQVRYTPDPGHPADSGTISVSGAATVRAPVPGSQLISPNAIPEPSGAP